MTRVRFETGGRRATCVLVAIAMAVLAQVPCATAAPVDVYLNYTVTSGAGFAEGVATVDDAFLAPSSDTGFTSDFTGLLAFSLTITGIAGVPSTTSFDLSDLDRWILSTDAAGQITDLNFFMDPPSVNGDGYSFTGTDPSHITLYVGPSDGRGIASFQGDPTVGEPQLRPVPALSAAGVALLLLLLGTAGVLVLRR